MKKLAALFTRRWLLSAFGLSGVALVIWFFVPRLSFGGSPLLQSPAARLIAILLVVVLWALNELRKTLKANKANQGMVEGLVEADAPAEPDRSAEEVATLKERFEQAVAVLKKAKGKRGRLSLYDLPWYIIIGPPGSGKTTALVNSGLDFPLAEEFGREALGGVGGTRNCDWWFTDEAILLDTAGRYTTQDSDADVDRSAWEGFLALLKKYRRRRPINGVVVAISLLDLMTLNEQDRAAHARAIKTRIQELDRYFKIRFPVYVVLTKCDLVAGFSEFFDDLARHEREQVWGATFPIEQSEAGAAEHIGAELDALLARLNERLLWRMSQERDPRRRAAIYGFPRQLASLKGSLEAFLGDVFRGSRFEQAPMLRGFYFTSGTQQGAPIDRLMGMVARTFGLDQRSLAAQGGQGRSYFIKSLLTDVMFAEAELAGTNRRLELQRAWAQKAAYAGSVAVTVAVVAGWFVSYFNNRGLVAEVQAATESAAQALDEVTADDRDLTRVLPALEAARTIPGGYAERDEGTPWLHGLGLYQGGKLGRQAEAAYRRVLNEVLLPRLMLRMENQMRGGGPERQYEVLMRYLMLDSREHYDRDEMLALWRDEFEYELPRDVGTPAREALYAHAEALFERQPQPLPLPLDQALIEEAQRAVARIPIEERVYSRLESRGAGSDLPPFTLFDAGGPQAPIVFTRASNAGLRDGIDGLFTREGYQRVFLIESASLTDELVDESWILGDYAPADLDETAVFARVRELYLEEYARRYDALLADIELAPFSSAEEASRILNILSDPAGSPLTRLLRAVAEETQLETQAEQAAGSVGERVRDAADSLGELFGRDGDGEREPQSESGTAALASHFRWVREFVGGEDPSAAPIQGVLSQLDELYRFMAVVVSERGLQGGDIPANVAAQGQAVVQGLQAEARRQPAMIQTLLEDAASRSQSLAFSGVMAYLDREWQSRGLQFCRDAVSGRYPIAREAAQEIRLDDFGRFFGPGGIVDSFFGEFLADYVDRSQSTWRARSSSAVPVRLSADAVRQFQRADAIRRTFFRRSGELPSVSFELRPVGMDADINQFTLDLAGQRVTYSHGPPLAEPMTWPGADQNGEVRIEMTLRDGTSPLQRERGPWAWFRVLDGASIEQIGNTEEFRVEFTLGERTAVYDLLARSAYNPFRFPELEQFRCPESLGSP